MFMQNSISKLLRACFSVQRRFREEKKALTAAVTKYTGATQILSSVETVLLSVVSI